MCILTEPDHRLRDCLTFLYIFIQTHDLTSFVVLLWDNVSISMANVSLMYSLPTLDSLKTNTLDELSQLYKMIFLSICLSFSVGKVFQYIASRDPLVSE